MNINWLLNIPRAANKLRQKALSSQEQQIGKIGREQFKKLLDKGLSVPVALL